jgi:hypothetical protein
MDRRYSRPRREYYEDSDEYWDSEEDTLGPSTSSTARPAPPVQPQPQSKMASWFQRTTSSTQAQFAATALVSGAVVAGAILGYQHVRRQERVEDLKSSIPALGRDHAAEKVSHMLLQCASMDNWNSWANSFTKAYRIWCCIPYTRYE